MRPPASSLLAGKYEPVRPVGKGGMASVWLGLTHGEAGFKRKVAIKRLLKDRTEDAEFATMFVEEARVVAELNHPNIAQVHDFGVDEEGRYFIVMEWVQGLSLNAYAYAFARGGQPTAWHLIAGIMIEVLRALQAAHERKDESGHPAPVIHRDVTPSNILVGSNGVVKLTDFGLSRAMDRPSRTRPGTVKGKVGYMAPELLRGQPPHPGVDLYSVAVVMWETLSMQRLYGQDGNDVATAMRVLAETAPDLGEFRSDLPEPLVKLVHRALRPEPQRRYPSAAAMIYELTHLLRRLPHHTGASALAGSVREAEQLLAKYGGPPAKDA
jgi:serine/threonine protein kinase